MHEWRLVHLTWHEPRDDPLPRRHDPCRDVPVELQRDINLTGRDRDPALTKVG